MTLPLKLVGAPGSPYTRKMRALLRYRRIPYEFVIRDGPDDHGIPEVPVRLIPVLVFPGESGDYDDAMIDSSFQIRRLEELYEERSVTPPDPAMAFLDALLEDFADEWLTKAMFHYRWAHDRDADFAAAILPRWRRTDRPESEVAPVSRFIRQRQIDRLYVVGSNDVTGPVIEQSYHRILRALDAHLERHRFLMGGRPGASDFGFFGQLTQLALFDPTPAAVTFEQAPRVIAWCEVVEDLSGAAVTYADWLVADAIPETLRALLGEVGRYYAPFLVANAEAVERGAESVETEIDGRKWVQPPFPYQAKCLRWLREAHAALPGDARAGVDSMLAGTGCERLLTA